MADLTRLEQDKRWTLAVLKLIKLTRDGKLKWVKTPTNSQVSAGLDIYQTVHEGQTLRIRKGTNIFEILSQSTGSKSSPDVRLDIVSAEGQTLWTFPHVEAIVDLFQTVSYYQSGVGTYLDRLLNEP